MKILSSLPRVGPAVHAFFSGGSQPESTTYKLRRLKTSLQIDIVTEAKQDFMTPHLILLISTEWGSCCMVRVLVQNCTGQATGH